MEDVDSEEFINGYIRRLTYHEFYNNYEEIGGLVYAGNKIFIPTAWR